MVINQQEPQEIEEDLTSESAPEDENTEDTEAQDQESEAEASEDSPEEKVTFSDAQQSIFNREMNKKVAQKGEVDRKLDETQRELADLRAAQPKPKAPTIPPVPSLDDFITDPQGYEKAVQERDEAIAASTRFDEQTKAHQDEQARQANEQQQVQIKETRKSIESYEVNSDSFGIAKDQRLQEAALVGGAMTRPEVALFIINDPHGPLITNHLANNPLELDKLVQMSTPEAAIYIATEIKPKLKGAKKGTKAPKPADIIKGQGAGDNKFPHTKGAKFE